MKEKQKQLLSEIMQDDEKSGLYDDLVYTAAEYYSEGYGNNNDKESFLAGAKWQQKQMYSEEEARKIWYAGQDYWRTNGESITFEELTSNLIRNKNQKSYSAQQVFELMKQAFEAGFKKAYTVEAGLEHKETEQEINWILLKQNNK